MWFVGASVVHSFAGRYSVMPVWVVFEALSLCQSQVSNMQGVECTMPGGLEPES